MEKCNQNLIIKRYHTLNYFSLILEKKIELTLLSSFENIKHFKRNNNITMNKKPTFLRAKSIKTSKSRQSNKFNLFTPYNNLNFNNCSFVNYNTSNKNKNLQKKEKITIKSILDKKQNNYLSKIKKEHNIKFKNQKNNTVSLNKTFNSMKLSNINLTENDNLNDYSKDMIEIEYETSNNPLPENTVKSSNNILQNINCFENNEIYTLRYSGEM